MATADYWLCRCGGYNALHVDKCPSCGFEKSSRQTFSDVHGVNSELGLHDEIIQLCRARRWPYIHARPDVKSTIATGAADFVILLPGGRVLIVECKSRTGKQTPEQLGWQIQVENVGHQYHLVRSYAEFMDLIESNGL